MITHLKRWKRSFERSVARKIGGVVAIMLVLAVLTVAGTYLMVQQQHDDARVINIAGRQRMLSQHIAKHAFELGVEVEREGGEETRRSLSEATALFDTSLKSLRKGDPAQHLSPAPAGVQPQLAKVADLWEEFYAQVRIVEQGRPEDTSFRQALEFIRANNEKLLAESDVAVSLFEEEANRKISALLRFLYLLLLLDVLAFAGTFLLLRHLVLTPLHEIRRGLAILARGNLDHRLTLRTGDELQEVAEEVNVMATRLQASRATLEWRVAERTQELTQANRELRRLDRVRAELLANVSHELRTPLIPVSSLAQLMLGGKAGPLTAEQRGYLQAMTRSADRLQRFSDQLLGTVRRDRGRETFRPVRLDLCQVLRESAGTVTPAIEAKSLHFDLCLPDGPLWVEGDSGMLRQVFDNLLGNAAKFTPPGGRVTLTAWGGGAGEQGGGGAEVQGSGEAGEQRCRGAGEQGGGGAEVQGSGGAEERGATMEAANGRISESRRTNYASRVTHHVKRDNIPTCQRANATRNPKSKIANPKSVVVEVRDTGVGISEEEQARIFERFYQAAGRGYTGGTGLGLAIVKELVELHGGSASVRSKPGRESTFTIVLPWAGSVSETMNAG